MSAPFRGVINVDVPDSVPEGTPYLAPKAKGEHVIDLEKEGLAAMARD